jgi:hypothetical protein
MLHLAVVGDQDVSALYGPDSEEKKALMGRLRLRENKWKDGEREYLVLQYTRPITDEPAGEKVGHLRSVVHRNGKIVCVAPARARVMTRFAEAYNPFECVAEEVVEGTMVNLFYDDEWRLATRGTVGARSRFYKGAPTFRQMFLEAAGAAGLDFERLPKEYCYSFSVQHPKNRIVCPVATARLYLVGRYQIDADARTATRIPYSDAISALLAGTDVRFPDTWPMSDFDAVTAVYAATTTAYAVPGVMFRHAGTGARAKVCNPNYEAVRRLRGNHPKEQYRYLVLRQACELDAYLRYYPEDREAFRAFAGHVDAFIKQLHSSYVQARPLRGGDEVVERHLRPHVRALHKIYLRTLRAAGRRVHYDTVTAYVSTLPPARLMHAVNYPLRRAVSHPAPEELARASLSRVPEVSQSAVEADPAPVEAPASSQ